MTGSITTLSRSTLRYNDCMRLLIIDDAPDIADLLARAFRDQGYAVDTAPNGDQGVGLASINEYDLVVLDLNLPDRDGLLICRDLRASCPQMLIIVLTARSRIEDRVLGLDLGADDYLSKPFAFEELAARVRALLRRDMRVREPILQHGDLKIDLAAQMVWQGTRRLELTRKEFGILAYLLRRAGEVVSQEDLLEHVWDADANPFTNTVRVHINSLRRKLGDSSAAPRYIETLIGAGYRLIPPEHEDEQP